MEKTLNRDQVKAILDNAPKGADKGLIVEGLAKQGYKIEGFNDAPKVVEPTPLAKPGYRADTSKMSTIEKVANTVNEVTGIGDLAAKGTQQLAQYVASKYPNDPILQKLADTGNQFAPSAEQTKAAGLKAASTGLALASGGSSIPATIALGAGAGYTQDVASNIEAGKQGVERYTPGISTAIGVAAPLIAPVADVLKALPKAVSEGFSKVPDLPTGIAEKAMNFISADPQAKVVTILKRSTPDEVASVVESARKASISGEAPTPFEITGNKLADTAKVLQTKLNEIGKAKSDIILPLREGLGAFKAETKPFIDKLTSLKNSFSEIDASSRNIVQAAINDAKTVATKMDADKLIDKLQDALYSGNQNQTIVQGSAVDKQLRGILKTYNDALKASLPKEYAVLNDKYSKLVDTLSVINKSLGDVVEGVPIRGASLIKQYFSPSGSKAKEIFEFIKKETNGEVDLAKDATLSKFAMELFDDTRANSLLSGIGDIPTTVGGVVSKVIEKVGGEKLISSMRDSTIKKAKDLAGTPKK